MGMMDTRGSVEGLFRESMCIVTIAMSMRIRNNNIMDMMVMVMMMSPCLSRNLPIFEFVLKEMPIT